MSACPNSSCTSYKLRPAFWLELAQIHAESIGWIPLDESAYLHVGSDAPVIQVVGISKDEMAGSNVLWLL
jgi:hypothetical protein